MEYTRITLKEARKLWDNGEKIYLLPSIEGDPIFLIWVYVDKAEHKEFDKFVSDYKRLTGGRAMRYYIERVW